MVGVLGLQPGALSGLKPEPCGSLLGNSLKPNGCCSLCYCDVTRKAKNAGGFTCRERFDGIDKGRHAAADVKRAAEAADLGWVSCTCKVWREVWKVVVVVECSTKGGWRPCHAPGIQCHIFVRPAWVGGGDGVGVLFVNCFGRVKLRKDNCK